MVPFISKFLSEVLHAYSKLLEMFYILRLAYTYIFPCVWLPLLSIMFLRFIHIFAWISVCSSLLLKSIPLCDYRSLLQTPGHVHTRNIMNAAAMNAPVLVFHWTAFLFGLYSRVEWLDHRIGAYLALICNFKEWGFSFMKSLHWLCAALLTGWIPPELQPIFGCSRQAQPDQQASLQNAVLAERI